MKDDWSDILDMSDVEEMVADTVLEISQKITLDVHKGVVIATPVDTGEARGGWKVETPNKPFENGTIENPVEHIVFLMEGSSDQAPNGFVDNVIQAAVRMEGK